MIGIKTAEAVITSLETLLLANTQEFSLAYSLLHDSLTCFMIYIMIIVQGANFMFLVVYFTRYTPQSGTHLLYHVAELLSRTFFDQFRSNS